MTIPIPADEEVLETGNAPDKRVWTRRSGAHGSIGLSLQVFAILYDAGRPLTLDELIAELEARIDPVSAGYIEAWHLRRRQTQASANRKRGHSGNEVNGNTSLPIDRRRAVRSWLMQVFFKRVQDGHTLIRDSTGRYAPGPSAPRINTMDGRLLRYTPEMRHKLAKEDQEKSRTHIALLEWKQVMARPELATFEARVSGLMFLLRRLMLNQTKTKKNPVLLDERALAAHFTHLLRVADSPIVKGNVIRQIVEEIFGKPETAEESHE